MISAVLESSRCNLEKSSTKTPSRNGVPVALQSKLMLSGRYRVLGPINLRWLVVVSAYVVLISDITHGISVWIVPSKHIWMIFFIPFVIHIRQDVTGVIELI